MRDKVVDKIMYKIKEKNKELDDIKCAEIRYGLQAIYTLITKSIVTFLLALIFGIFKDFIIFLAFYIPLRGVGYGTHAKSNLHCWIFSTLFLLGIPFCFSYFTMTNTIKIVLWGLFFIMFLIFSPADTKKRPMINKKRKLKFKFTSLLICLIYLILIFKFDNISNLILGAMLLESMLICPLGYILMGEEVRFRLNDLYIFKLN